LPTLFYVNIATQDLEKLPRFYTDLFGFEEARATRTPDFRAVLSGKTTIGFSAAPTYAALNLPEPPRGTKLILTFDVSHIGEVDAKIERAIALGAKLLKPAFRTSYSHYQAVLLDPEGNGFRINTILEQTSATEAHRT